MNIQEEKDRRLKEIEQHSLEINKKKEQIKVLQIEVRALDKILQKVNEILK